MANRVGTALLNHFSPTEFKFPESGDPVFLVYLDNVRDKCGFPFEIQSDGRSAEHNAEVGGVPTSLHIFEPGSDLRWRAVDFWFPLGANERPYAQFAVIAEAVAKCAEGLQYRYELELVYDSEVTGSPNHHVHLGLFRDPSHPAHLVVKKD